MWCHKTKWNLYSRVMRLKNERGIKIDGMGVGIQEVWDKILEILGGLSRAENS